MQSLLHDIVTANVLTFLVLFMRFGTALMLMPGFGDGFVTAQTRLLFALAFCFVLTPVLSSSLPPVPHGGIEMLLMLMSEAMIGLFIGTIMRVMLAALDTAGAILSIQAGYSNALIFNPVLAGQGTMAGALFALLGVTLLMVTDMHHYMLAAIVDSYNLFPAKNGLPDAGDMSEIIGRLATLSFKIGVQMTIPFLVIGTLLQAGLGLLGRLMPQVQIFFLAMPLQIMLSLILLAMTLSASLLFWMNGFESAVTQAIAP